MKSVRLLAALSLVLAASTSALEDASVSYPSGYRDWHHVKSMVIQSGHPLYDAVGGVHHVYANDKALEALRSAKAFADGAVLIFDLLEASAEASAISEGPRKFVGVMAKDSKKHAATGGWGFEGFRGDTQEPSVTDVKTQCFDCHQTRKSADYVFSQYRK